MQVSVTFRQLEPSEALKTYVTDRLKKFKRYLDGPLEAHVVLGLEKFRHLADITINSNGHMVKGREENADMYAAIDLVMDKIDMQLRKYRGKLREVKADRTRPMAATVEPEEPQARPWNFSRPRAIPSWSSPMSIPGPYPSCTGGLTAVWDWPNLNWGRTPFHEDH